MTPATSTLVTIQPSNDIICECKVGSLTFDCDYSIVPYWPQAISIYIHGYLTLFHRWVIGGNQSIMFGISLRISTLSTNPE